MQLDRLTVKNFRNLADIDIELSPGTVIVGENRSGKSNLIEALRLVFDSSMSHADRELQKDDFWYGLFDGEDDWDPTRDGHAIEVSVELSNFEHIPAAVAALSHALLPGDPMRAQLTYTYAPVSFGADDVTRYRARVYGGGDPENAIASDLRSYLHMAFMHALRDVESDIQNWRRSPLRKLLERAVEKVSTDEISDAQTAIHDANSILSELSPIQDLGEAITSQTENLVGDRQSLQTQLAIASPDPLRMLRTMRLFVDGDAARPLHTASLGTLNVLYFALLQLQLDDRLDSSEIAHVVMGIEEPEAHLHPHLQRLLFRDLLRDESHSQSVVVTTQSPYIASVAEPRSLIVLRENGGKTTAHTARSAQLTEREWDDISRYLDATRAELVFARRVLLVEGYAEQVLIPSISDSEGISLDKEGITVCAIHGTHFAAYARFCDALAIPWAIITDGDPGDDGIRAGDARATSIIRLLGHAGTPSENGIFVGSTTLEHDIFATSDRNARVIQGILSEIAPNSRKEQISGWRTVPPTTKELVNTIVASGGKGRFAQRLATHELDSPTSLTDALSWLGC